MVDRRHRVARIDLVARVDAIELRRGCTARRGPRRAPARAGCCRSRRATSPCGFPFVSSARLTISPASPPCRIVSFSPLSCSNAAFTVLRDRERVVRDEHDLLALASPEPPHPAATTASATASAPQTLCQSVTRTPLGSGPGWTAIRQPRATVTWASVAAKTFETPRLVPAGRVSSCERVLEPARRDALGRAVEGEQRDELAGRARRACGSRGSP